MITECILRFITYVSRFVVTVGYAIYLYINQRREVAT